MTTLVKENVLGLSVSERIQMVEDIWDTIAEVPDEVDLSTAQRAELESFKNKILAEERKLQEKSEQSNAG